MKPIALCSSKSLNTTAAPTCTYKVMEHLKKLGYKPAERRFGKRPNPSKDKAAFMGKVEALLADRKLHWSSAHAMAQRMFKVEKVDWLDRDQ